MSDGYGHALGDFPLGGFPDSIDGSVADPLPGLLRDSTQRREFLVRAQVSDYIDPAYIDPDYITGVQVDLSSGGYISQPTDTEYKLFSPAIAKPYSFQASLPIPDRGDAAQPAIVTGGSTLTVGDIIINNADALQDQNALLDWLGAKLDVLLGRPDDPLTNFTTIFSGSSSGVSKSIDSWSILMRDMRFRLQKRLQSHVYIGTGGALRVSTVGDAVVVSGFPSQTGSFTVEARVYVSNPTGSLQQWITQDDGAHGWSMGTTSTGNLRFLTRGLSVGNTDAAVAPTVGWHQIAMSWDSVNKIKTIILDGSIVKTTSGVSGSLATSSANLQFFAGGTGNSAAAKTGLDEVRIWNIARSLPAIQSTMNRALVGNETGLIGLYHLDEGFGTITADSSATGANGTITGCQWVGSLEGDASTAGTVKPVALGKKRQVTGVLVDSQHLIYQLNDGPMKAIDAGRDSGDPLTAGVDVADLYDSTPAPGTYNTCLARGLARLGSDPIGAITWDIRGDSAGPLGYQDSAPGIHLKLMTQYGGLSNPAEIDVASYNALYALQPATTGRYYDSAVNIDVAGDDVMKSICAWWSPTRLGLATVGRIDAPETLTPTVFVTSDDIADPDTSTSGAGAEFDPGTPIGVRVGHVQLGYRPYATVLTGTQSSPDLSQGVRNDLAQSYRYVTSDDPNASDYADTLTILTDIDDPVVAQAESDRLLAFWQLNRETVTIPLDDGALSYFFGTVFNVQISRYDLVTGKNYVLVAVDEDMGSQSTGTGSGASPTPDSLSVTLLG